MPLLNPNWPAPPTIKAYSTLRQGGASLPPYESFNLGMHVGDNKNFVKMNRTLLMDKAHLPQYPLFLNQIHSTQVISLPCEQTTPNADGVYTNHPEQVCLVMTADCLPVLFCNEDGTEVAAAHAGWRGLCEGILEKTLSHFKSPPEKILTWLGPAIGPTAFQVGEEVKSAFMQHSPFSKNAFIPDPNTSNKYLANLYMLATQRLNQYGVTQISGGEYCTFTEKEKFFSYRRDGITGRMASFIWIKNL